MSVYTTRWRIPTVAALTRVGTAGTSRLCGKELLQNIRRHTYSPSQSLLNFRVVNQRLLSVGKVFAASGDLGQMIQQKNAENKVIVYSRSWCPFCADVRQLLDQYKVSAKFVDLDEIVEGDDIQDALLSMTGSGTVPQVFIGGKFVGGCDDTYLLHQQGKLKALFEEAGAEFL